MPIITIKIARGRPVSVKKRLAEKLTEIVGAELDIKKEWITILFDEYDRENWASGGELHSEKFGPGFGKAGTGE